MKIILILIAGLIISCSKKVDVDKFQFLSPNQSLSNEYCLQEFESYIGDDWLVLEDKNKKISFSYDEKSELVTSETWYLELLNSSEEQVLSTIMSNTNDMVVSICEIDDDWQYDYQVSTAQIFYLMNASNNSFFECYIRSSPDSTFSLAIQYYYPALDG